MIGFIKGNFAYTYDNTIVVDVNGIGYEIHVPASSELLFKEAGDELMVYTVMTVREDDMSLYGFMERAEVAMWRMLLTVNGVGAKAALAILSIMTPAEIASAVANEDKSAFTKASGIGKRGAERIIVDLKDKDMGFAGEVVHADGTKSSISRTSGAQKDNAFKVEAAEVLTSLGYSKAEASAALDRIEDSLPSVEEYVRIALRSM